MDARVFEVPARHTLPDNLRFGETGNIAGLFTTIRARIQDLGMVLYPSDDKYYERQEWATKAEHEFLSILMNYGAWSNPTGWQLDFIDSTGAFGILFTGEYTCLVQMNSTGGASGHS